MLLSINASRALRALTLAAGLLLGTAAGAQDKLRFAVGPFQPTPNETRKAYEPFFKHLAQALKRDYELTITNDWAGIAIALANAQADLAWMGPWGYVLAHHEGGAQAIATVKYDGKPYYHSIMLARPDLAIKKWPDDAKGLRASFADVGSTSGWLIPTYWFKSQGIDPKSFFQYRDGASHPANVLAVANGQTDLATDYDRNRNGMIERGTVAADATKIVWTSDPLPNDPIVVRKGLGAAMVKTLQATLTGIDENSAKTLLPPHYTGFVPASHDSYKLIEDAGIAIGRIKPKGS